MLKECIVARVYVCDEENKSEGCSLWSSVIVCVHHVICQPPYLGLCCALTSECLINIIAGAWCCCGRMVLYSFNTVDYSRVQHCDASLSRLWRFCCAELSKAVQVQRTDRGYMLAVQGEGMFGEDYQVFISDGRAVGQVLVLGRRDPAAGGKQGSFPLKIQWQWLVLKSCPFKIYCAVRETEKLETRQGFHSLQVWTLGCSWNVNVALRKSSCFVFFLGQKLPSFFVCRHQVY